MNQRKIGEHIGFQVADANSKFAYGYLKTLNSFPLSFPKTHDLVLDLPPLGILFFQQFTVLALLSFCPSFRSCTRWRCIPLCVVNVGENKLIVQRCYGALDVFKIT